MKKQLTLATLVLVATLASILTACGPQFGPIHPEAHSLLVYWQDAVQDNDRNVAQCTEAYQSCTWNNNLNGQNTAEKQQQCANDFSKCTEDARKIFEQRINIRFTKACGATIFGAPGTETDTDGDGLTNYIELKMGLSPCHKQTFQGTDDGDLDLDFDGQKNKDDKSPYCNPAYQSDCI